MTRWLIPAKTFLVGEYVALSGGPAVVLTTSPCFEVSWSEKTERAFHPNSPAGRFCDDHGLTPHLSWFDPYHGLGGLGGSSAEFIGSFRAYCEINNRPFLIDELLTSYWHYAWSKTGARPSGYDVIAQTMDGCALIHQAEEMASSSDWVFEDIGYILVHTHHKLPTHHHLEQIRLDKLGLLDLHSIAKSAQVSFKSASSSGFIEAVQAYHDVLDKMKLVTPTTQGIIKNLSLETKPLAIKGCGALGADVVLMLIERERVYDLKKVIESKKYTVVATSEDIYRK